MRDEVPSEGAVNNYPHSARSCSAGKVINLNNNLDDGG